MKIEKRLRTFGAELIQCLYVPTVLNQYSVTNVTEDAPKYLKVPLLPIDSFFSLNSESLSYTQHVHLNKFGQNPCKSRTQLIVLVTSKTHLLSLQASQLQSVPVGVAGSAAASSAMWWSVAASKSGGSSVSYTSQWDILLSREEGKYIQMFLHWRLVIWWS